MTYDQLDAFVAVAAAGTFTAASVKLHKSQPAVSKLVANLEAELGLRLFDREGLRPELTDAGRLFLDRARLVLDATTALEDYGTALSSEPEPIVRLAVEAVAPLHSVLESLAATRSRFPATRFELRTERLSGAIDAMLGGEAHLAISSVRPRDGNALETRRVGTVRVFAVVRSDHPIAHADPDSMPALLRQHPQVVLTDSTRGDLSQSLNVLRGGVRWTVTDIASKKQIIVSGMGWGGLPEHAIAKELADGTLCSIDVPDFDVEAMELLAVRRRDRPLRSVALALWDALTKGPADAPAHPR
ncbi:MAG: LysR family transcriptional regulator [Myxococcota bacterium]